MKRAGLWLSGLLILAAVAAVAWWLGSSAQTPLQAAAKSTEPPASWITAPVEFRQLAATIIQRGDVLAQSTTRIVSPTSIQGEPVVTKLDVFPGDVVDEGDKLLEVSGRPVFVLQGHVPAYRTLAPGMSGDDVAELQASLARLGFDIDVDGVFGAQTKSAVASLYASVDLEPIAASSVTEAELEAAMVTLADANVAAAAAQTAVEEARKGQPASVVAAAEAARNDAQRQVDEAKQRQQQDNASAQALLDAANEDLDRINADPAASQSDIDAAAMAVDQAVADLERVQLVSQDAVDSATDHLTTAEAALAEAKAPGDTTDAQAALDAALAAQTRVSDDLARLQKLSGPTIPLGEVVFVPATPARVLSVPATLGPLAEASDSTGADQLAELTGGDLVVMTEVRPTDVGLIRTGMDVVLLDEATGIEYQGKLTELANDPTQGANGQVSYPATIAPREPLPGQLTGANLRVTISAASTEGPALVVPLAAVTSAADGTTRVSVVDGPNSTPFNVDVTAGLSANGFVAIEPLQLGALSEGDLVVIGR